MPYKIVLGPDYGQVKRNSVVSETFPLTADDTAFSAKEKAMPIIRKLNPEVAFFGWIKHRLEMSRLRRVEAAIRENMGDTWFIGPMPGLVSTVWWEKAKKSEWVSVPNGAAEMLLRS